MGCIPFDALGYRSSIVLAMYLAKGRKSVCGITELYVPSLNSTLARNR